MVGSGCRGTGLSPRAGAARFFVGRDLYRQNGEAIRVFAHVDLSVPSSPAVHDRSVAGNARGSPSRYPAYGTADAARTAL